MAMYFKKELQAHNLLPFPARQTLSAAFGAENHFLTF